LIPSTENGVSKRWLGRAQDLARGDHALKSALSKLRRPVYVVAHEDQMGVTHAGSMVWGRDIDMARGMPLLGFAPPLTPDGLGDAGFKADLGIDYAYVVGAMANGITSVEMVQAAGQAGMVGFFGAGGLSLDQVAHAVQRLLPYREKFSFGFNLIHSPNDPLLEMAVVELYLRHGIRLVSASAYLRLTLALVYYRVKGIHRNGQGRIVCPNRVVGKVSRMEVAQKFWAPPPQAMLSELVQQGKISAQEAELARHIPVAQEITAEADSGGHTDNRPALTLLPTFLALRDQAMIQHGYDRPLRVGLGGGIATPDAVAAAFAMGAAYVLTGSINQAAVEADTSPTVRDMLVQAQQADVTMAPSADMFELGVKVQVLKRGTMFAMRAAKLYEIYRSYDRYDDIPVQLRTSVERDILRSGFNEAWEQTRLFFEGRDPHQNELAENDPHHKMALVFRSYLGQASLWAKQGVADRQIDYQIWCGPAMGAFNAWGKGSCLEAAPQRLTATMAMNLMCGAAVLTRCQWLRNQGVLLPARAASYQPMSMDDINICLGN
jgi:trans-AT polyketide synthase, acyltransferase and oxidoreductase domains